MMDVRLGVVSLFAMAALASGCFLDRADTEEICAKCAECYEADSSFDEGFCDPYWDGSHFDTSSCIDEADEAELDGTPSSSEVEDASCSEFDTLI